ncbi:hypothetical protein [Streptomyces sp. HB2AG]|uniref:hypothetical protein n=1 Tax=Streptomyces sp. HB2AG TaxID=2983400 RepID=UPI0022AAB7EB|nr:hypothetical protein [Streptomyces sp. HB2AG]MCZ2526382.1 hypothetical protein [Streptomyces sp. HB2AG]
MTPLYDGPPAAAPGRAAPGRTAPDRHRTPGTGPGPGHRRRLRQAARRPALPGTGRALAARATGGEER